MQQASYQVQGKIHICKSTPGIAGRSMCAQFGRKDGVKRLAGVEALDDLLEIIQHALDRAAADAAQCVAQHRHVLHEGRDACVVMTHG